MEKINFLTAITRVFHRRIMYKQTNSCLEEEAIVLESALTGAQRKGLLEARMLLQVMPRDGRNYILEYRNYFTESQLSRLTTGAKTTISFDPAKRSKIRSMKASVQSNLL